MRTIIEISIASFLAYIAYQNYKINKANFRMQEDKLRLDLFDRRYRIFRAFQELFSAFRKEGTITQEKLFKFMTDSSDAEFLFENDIKIYRDKIRENGLRLIHSIRRLNNQNLEVGEERSKFANEAYELEKWFAEQIEISIDLFRKYLYFSIWRE